MWNQLQFDLTIQDHLLEQLILPNVCPNVLPYLPVGKQQSHSKTINTNVVTDGCEVLRILFHQSANQVFRDAAQPKAAHHDGGAVEYVADRFIRTPNHFVHKRGILIASE